MTHLQFRKALEMLSLSIVGSGKYLGLSKRQAQRIAAGTAPVPPLAAKALELVLAGKIQLEDLLNGPETESRRTPAL